MNRLVLKLAVCAFAAPIVAQAQGIDCRTGIDGEWIAGDQGASNVVSFMDIGPVDLGISIPTNGVHVSLFEVEGTDSIRIEAVGIDNADPFIEVRNENGILIAEDDDSGGNANARIETILDPGVYCIATRGFDGAAIDATVRVGTVGQEPLSVDDGYAYCDANTNTEWLNDGSAIDAALAGGVSFTGSADSTPYIKFVLDTDASLSISATNADADPVVYLFDAAGNLLAENDDYDGLDSRIDMAAPLSAGEYCVGIRALTDTSLPITVSAFAYDAEAIMRQTYDDAESAPPLDGSYPVEDLGNLAGRIRVDANLQEATKWYSLEVEQAGLLLIEGISVGGSDPYIVFFDDVGRELGRDDDSGDSFDSLIATRIFPGTYLIGVSEAGGSGSGTVRLVVERYVAAQ